MVLVYTVGPIYYRSPVIATPGWCDTRYRTPKKTRQRKRQAEIKKKKKTKKLRNRYIEVH